MRGAIVLVVVAGCHCGESKPAAPPIAPSPKDAAVAAPVPAPLGQADADAALACLLDGARGPRELLTLLVDEVAPAPLVRRAVDTSITLAQRDGESPMAMVLADAVDIYAAIDDREALRATFQQIDKLSGVNSMRFNHQSAERTLVGIAVDPKDFAADEFEIVRARAVSGDAVGAAKLYDETMATRKKVETYQRDPQLAALVAIDRIADAKAIIDAAKDEDRLKLAGLWLDVTMQRKRPLDEALQVVLAQLAVAPERGLTWFGERAVFVRAARLGRARELMPLYKGLNAKHATIKSKHGHLETEYELARRVGDADALKTLSADPRLADLVAMATGPLDAILAKAAAKKDYSKWSDQARVWIRATTEPVPPTFGAALVAAVCPPAVAKRGPATPPLAGVKLKTREKSRGMREECDLHDLVITLTDASGKKLGTETLDGECTGACTKKEKREGQNSLDEIQKRIDEEGETQSLTDYNFTDCMFKGPDDAEMRTVAGRPIALIPIHGIGPHDVPKTTYVLAFEACGELHVLDGFGDMYAHTWQPEDLTIRESDDKTQIIVDGKSDFWNGVVFRVTMPECPGTPEGKALQTE